MRGGGRKEGLEEGERREEKNRRDPWRRRGRRRGYDPRWWSARLGGSRLPSGGRWIETE